MISKMISAVLVAAILQGSIAAQDQARSQQQTITTMQHFLRKAQEKNKAVKVTLNKKINNQRKVSGGVSGISDTGFVIDDEKTGTATTVAIPMSGRSATKACPRPRRLSSSQESSLESW